jgi:hypothetical protein
MDYAMKTIIIINLWMEEANLSRCQKDEEDEKTTSYFLLSNRLDLSPELPLDFHPSDRLIGTD